MGDISIHFSRSEFKSKRDKWVKDIPVDVELIQVLEDIRIYFNRPVIISSGYRSEILNNTLKNSSPTSKHLLGMAADIKIKGIKPRNIYDYLDKKYHRKYGLGIYKTFIHCDCRKNKARWDYTK